MDNTPYKGMVTTSSQFHLHHHQDWMNTNSAMAAAGTAEKIEVVDEDGSGGEGGGKSVIEREHMFDKVVTPSDVGKLNRLVIPKQHAEKYFPLDSTNNEKGLLLNFEDRTGKPWRFRYSYWNSSQSYVMTKGWSRFVKEKKLDAGDIVSFQRGVGDVGKDKLFIDWRRRPDGSSNFHHQSHHHPYGRGVHPTAFTATGWSGGVGSGSGSGSNFVLRSHPHHPYPYGGGGAVWDHHGASHLSSMNLMNVLPSQSHPLRRGGGAGMGLGLGTGYGYGSVVNPYPVTGPLFLVRSSSAPSVSNSVVPVMQNVSVTSSSASDGGGEGGVMGGSIRMQVQRGECGDEPMVFESVPVVQGKAAAKRLRLFGVNMDCPISHQTHDFDILSSSLASSSSPNHHHHHPHHHNHNHHHQHDHSSISMGPPPLPLHPHSPSSSSFSSSPSQQQQYPHPHSQSSSRSFYNGGNSPDKGKSSSMSLDLDI